jgi:hypothetical protein
MADFRLTRLLLALMVVMYPLKIMLPLHPEYIDAETCFPFIVAIVFYLS